MCYVRYIWSTPIHFIFFLFTIIIIKKKLPYIYRERDLLYNKNSVERDERKYETNILSSNIPK